MKLIVRVDGTERILHISREGQNYRVESDGRVLNVDARTFGDKDAFSLLIDRKSYLVEAAPVKPERGEYTWLLSPVGDVLSSIRRGGLLHVG